MRLARGEEPDHRILILTGPGDVRRLLLSGRNASVGGRAPGATPAVVRSGARAESVLGAGERGRVRKRCTRGGVRSVTSVLGRAEFLHTLSASAIGPTGRNVVLLPHAASSRGTMTSVALRVFEPLVPPHALASLLHSMIMPTLRSLLDGGHLFVLMTSGLIRCALRPPPPPDADFAALVVAPLPDARMLPARAPQLVHTQVAAARRDGDTDGSESVELEADCEEEEEEQAMRQAADSRERDVRSGSDCGDSDGETGPSAAFHRQRSLRLPHPHLGSLPRCPPLLQLHCSGTGPGQGLSEMPAGLRGLALDIAAEWLDEYFTHGWCACAFPIAAGQAATRGHGVRAQRSGSGRDVERAAVAMARSMLTPRLSSRVSPRELKALVSISVRAVRQEWGQRRGVGKGWEACGGRGAAEAWGNRYAPPRIYKVVGPGTLSSQLLEGYLLDGVGLGSDARRKRALLSKVDDGRGGGAESEGVLGGLVLFSIALEPSPPTAGHSAVTWECRGRADGGTGCGSEAWVAAGLSALSALVDKLASWHVRVLVCQVSDCLLICSIICLAISCRTHALVCSVCPSRHVDAARNMWTCLCYTGWPRANPPFQLRMWLFLPLSFLSSSPCASVCMIVHLCTCTHARAHASGFACKCAHRCSLLRPDREESIQRCKRSVWNEASWRSNEPRFDTWVFRVCGCGHACAHARLNVCVCVCVCLCVWSPENQCHRIIMILSNKASRP